MKKTAEDELLAITYSMNERLKALETRLVNQTNVMERRSQEILSEFEKEIRSRSSYSEERGRECQTLRVQNELLKSLIGKKEL